MPLPWKMVVGTRSADAIQMRAILSPGRTRLRSHRPQVCAPGQHLALAAVMSKSSRNSETLATKQLKRELGNTIASLQTVESHIQSIEQRLVESQDASQREKSLKDKINELEQQVGDLTAKNTEESNAFATSIASLHVTYAEMVKSQKGETDKKLKEEVARFESDRKVMEQELRGRNKRIRDLEEAERKMLKEQQSQTNQHTADVRCIKEEHTKEVDRWTLCLKEAEDKAAVSEKEVKELKIMIDGKDTEIQRLKAELASLQHFSKLPTDRW